MLFHLFIYIVTGIVTGILGGLLGLGGGIIVVPALAWIFTYLHLSPSNIMHLAAGTSLATMILTAGMATLVHSRRRMINWQAFYRLVPGLFLGILLGVYTSTLLSTHWLKIIFGFFLWGMALRMWLNMRSHTTPELKQPAWLSATSSGIAIGTLSGLLGIGGGSLAIPLLLRLGLSIRQAAATSAVCTFTLGVMGAGSFSLFTPPSIDLPVYTWGYVYWPAALIIGLASIMMVPFGARLAQRLTAHVIKRIFILILLIIGAQMWLL